MKVADKVQKISVSLPASVLKYAEEYQKAHGLESRSDAVVEAFKALQQREWAEGYAAQAAEHRANPKLLEEELLEGTIADGLEPSNEETW